MTAPILTLLALAEARRRIAQARVGVAGALLAGNNNQAHPTAADESQRVAIAEAFLKTLNLYTPTAGDAI